MTQMFQPSIPFRWNTEALEAPSTSGAVECGLCPSLKYFNLPSLSKEKNCADLGLPKLVILMFHSRWNTEALEAPSTSGAVECGLCPAAHFATYEERAAHLRGPRHRPVSGNYYRCRKVTNFDLKNEYYLFLSIVKLHNRRSLYRAISAWQVEISAAKHLV